MKSTQRSKDFAKAYREIQDMLFYRLMVTIGVEEGGYSEHMDQCDRAQPLGGTGIGIEEVSFPW